VTNEAPIPLALTVRQRVLLAVALPLTCAAVWSAERLPLGRTDRIGFRPPGRPAPLPPRRRGSSPRRLGVSGDSAGGGVNVGL
jgi:hypothetical protein